jgi:hypothetical protein
VGIIAKVYPKKPTTIFKRGPYMSILATLFPSLMTPYPSFK